MRRNLCVYLITALFVLTQSEESFAGGCNEASFVKCNPTAANGRCLAELPRRVLRQRGKFDQLKSELMVDRVSVRDDHRREDAHAFFQVLSGLNGTTSENQSKFRNMSIHIEHIDHERKARDQKKDVAKGKPPRKSSRGWHRSTCLDRTLLIRSVSNQNRTALEGDRRGRGASNSAQNAHEMAHCLGWMGGEIKINGVSTKGSMYSLYGKFTKDYCPIKGYSRKVYFENLEKAAEYEKKALSKKTKAKRLLAEAQRLRSSARNEEFAEVFALYVTYPDQLRDHPNENCRNSLKFFAQFFGDKLAEFDSSGNVTSIAKISCDNRLKLLGINALRRQEPLKVNSPTGDQ